MPDTPDVSAPELSGEERRLLTLWGDIIERGAESAQGLEPLMLEQARIRRGRDVEGQPGAFEKIPYDEWLAGLDPDQREGELIKQEGRSDIMRLQRGDIEATPFGEYLGKQKQDMHAQLLRSGILPGSSAYAESMARADQGMSTTMAQLRQSQLASGRGLAGGVPTGPSVSPYSVIGAEANIASGFGGPLNVLGGQRAMEFGASQTNAQMQGQATSDLWMAGGMMGAAALSSIEFKEGIEEVDYGEALAMLRDLSINKFRYTEEYADGGAKEHMGMMAEMSPEAIRTGPGGKMVDLYDSIGLTIAALKKLDLDVTELKGKNNGS